MIDVRELAVTYQNGAEACCAVRGFSLHVERGDICALIGPSGCGKSTVLFVLSGILREYGGEALVGGAPPDPKTQRIGLVPQSYGLLNWASVYRNATLGLKVRREAPDAAAVAHILEKLGLAAHKNRFPSQLSGGQRQRVALARAFLTKPDVLLMDEPFSALDAITREEAQDLFLALWREYATTALVVTHSVEEAVYLGRRIAVMSPAPGRVAAVIDNPLFGREGLRLSAAYYAFAMDVRRRAQEAWGL